MNATAILHSDLNCFYASVEMMLNPELRNKPIAVCGSAEERHGIVLAKSEIAKKAGVKTGMANWQAIKCCPNLILVPPHYEEYIKYSRLTRQIYDRYTSLVEPFGMDECWLDVTGPRNPIFIADEIRNTIKNELGLTVSIGVSYNKIFAKLGSDMKKPDAITIITEDNFKDKVWPLKVSELIYCGPHTTEKLARYGIYTIGDLANSDEWLIKRELGKNGIALRLSAQGLGSSRVMPAEYTFPIKSIGHGITCTCDLHTNDEVKRVIYELCWDISHRLKLYKLRAGGIQLFLRSNTLSFLQFQKLLERTTQNPGDIASAAFSLFKEKYYWDTPVRAITVRAIRLDHSQSEQIRITDNIEQIEKKEKITDIVEEIRNRYGSSSMTYALLLSDKKMPEDGRDLVKMPSPMYK